MHDFPGLPPRERPRRRTQPRRHPAGRRPVQLGVRGGRPQRQGDDGDPASLRQAAVRRGSRSSLSHADRRRIEPERRGGRGHRHRGPVDEARRRRHCGNRKAGSGLRDRAPRRPRHDHARVEGGEGIRAVGERAAARRVPAQRALGVDASAANRTRHRAAARTRRSATRSTSSTRPAARWCSARRPS